jgi:hypothetical protein
MFSVCVPPHSKSRISAGVVPRSTSSLVAQGESYLRSYARATFRRMIETFDSKIMTHSAISTFELNQRVAAWISLLAVLLIYAPVASATLMAVTGACCGGDQCPIHGNHHPAKQNTSQHNDDAPVDCDRHGHSPNKMSSCSMSCCDTVEPAAVHAQIYVLVPLSLGAPLALSLSAVPAISPAGIFASASPLAPPPKSSNN